MTGPAEPGFRESGRAGYDRRALLRTLRSVALGTTLLASSACDKEEVEASKSAPAEEPADGADADAPTKEDEAKDAPSQRVEADNPLEVPNEGKAVAERRASLQLDRCLEGGCKQACAEDTERCRLSCSGGRCEQTGTGPNANLGCRGGDCTQTCEGDGKCRMTCVDGKCTQVCKSGECSLSCYGGGCQQTCEAGSTCELECEGRRCKQSCDDATSCKKI